MNGWESQAHPRRIDWYRVAAALVIVLSGVGLAVILWVLLVVWQTFLSLAGTA